MTIFIQTSNGKICIFDSDKVTTECIGELDIDEATRLRDSLDAHIDFLKRMRK